MLGEKIEKIIKEKKMRSKDISLISGITEGYLSDIKKGRAIPREEKFKQLIKALKLTKEEEEEVIFLWEKESSPKEFVKKYEILEKENKILKEQLTDSEKISSIIQEYEAKMKLIVNENEELKKYKLLLFLLPKEDRVFFIKKILRDIESNMKIKGKSRMFSKELDEIKKMLTNS
ncbi:MAG: helix-turn-helix domain-containing protein [Cetobacterium sp.]